MIYRVMRYLRAYQRCLLSCWLVMMFAGVTVAVEPLATGLRASLGKLPENESLAFCARVGGNLDIYLLTKTDLKRLTVHPSSDEAPGWSPDGTLLAFASKRSGSYEIYTMDRDGFDVRQLTRRASFANLPSWSPDGRTIAFASTPEVGGARSEERIFLMNSDGTKVRPLGLNEAFLRAAWSPRGEKVAIGRGGDWGHAIDIVSLDSMKATRLRESAANRMICCPAWSPDRRTIAYVSYATPEAGKPRDQISNIHLVDADGGDERQLTKLVAKCGWPAWSADGRRIAFSVYPPEFDLSAKGAIYIVDLDGSNLTRITDENEDAFFPAWRPAAK